MLREAFIAIAKDLREQEDLKNKVKGAVTYPIIIFFFLILAISVVMVYVVPQLMPIIGNMSGELPLTTRALIWTSTFMKENIFILLFTLTGIGLILLGYIRTEK
jgi:type II secretory pathway component PulF